MRLVLTSLSKYVVTWNLPDISIEYSLRGGNSEASIIIAYTTNELGAIHKQSVKTQVELAG